MGMVFTNIGFDSPYAGVACSPARDVWRLHPYQSLESQAGRSRGLEGGGGGVKRRAGDD